MKNYRNTWIFKDSNGFYRIAGYKRNERKATILPDKFTDRDCAEYARKYHV